MLFCLCMESSMCVSSLIEERGCIFLFEHARKSSMHVFSSNLDLYIYTSFIFFFWVTYLSLILVMQQNAQTTSFEYTFTPYWSKMCVRLRSPSLSVGLVSRPLRTEYVKMQACYWCFTLFLWAEFSAIMGQEYESPGMLLVIYLLSMGQV